MCLVSNLLLWGMLLFLGFLLLGILQVQARLAWRLEQLEAVTPSRLGRSGLRPGTLAPNFTCPTAQGGEMSLRDWAGRKVLMVFMQVGCEPCERIIPALNALQNSEDLQVVAINYGQRHSVHEWAEHSGAQFPVLIQENRDISLRYQVVATPFAFLIDGQGTVLSKGFVTKRQHLEFLITSGRVTTASSRASAQMHRTVTTMS